MIAFLILGQEDHLVAIILVRTIGMIITNKEFTAHDGLDIAVPVGTPIRAVLSGTVIFAGADGAGPRCNEGYAGYGLGIVLENETGWQVLYAHLSQMYVSVGETVSPDQIIGLSGNTGCSSGPHLHFGLRYRGDLVDPLAYLE